MNIHTTTRRRIAAAAAASVAAVLALAACSSGGGGEPGAGDKPYVALVSKGFQHQFWQAVKQGADDAAAELDVEVTFEGPETETEVEKQLTMLQTALDKSTLRLLVLQLFGEAAVSGLESIALLFIALGDLVVALSEAR